MSLAEIAEGLRTADPDRFGAALVAPEKARAQLWTLYALNLELARAPLQSNEPLIAEMRLQWWVDQLHKASLGMKGAHELLPVLSETWGVRSGELASLAEPRRRDCERQPFTDPSEVADYVRATSVPLMRFAASVLDLPDAALPALEAQAFGLGMANWLGALPALNALGMGLARPDPALVAALAKQGREAFRDARTQRRTVPRRLAPALFAPPFAGKVLDQLSQDGAAIPPLASEFQRRFALGRLALTGRWWI